MDSFQKTVLGISAFLLIFILILVGYMMSITNTDKVFPPVQQPCPDGWASDTSGNCYFIGKNAGTGFTKFGTINTATAANIASEFPLYSAKNTNGKLTITGTYPSGIPSNPPLDNSVTNTVMFNTNDPKWTTNGGQGICSQQKFANQYSIYWDGVSNTNQCASE
jgi:di/tricarboxylate transporter